MKKINLTLLVLLIALSGMAQYKKASYFGKDGRTYGLNTRFYMLGGELGTVRGYGISLGKDTEGKQLFSGYEFHYIPSYKVPFLTAYSNGSYYSGNFSTKAQIIYTVNIGYFLLKNDDADRKVKPYLLIGVGAKLWGGIKDVEDDKEMAADIPFSIHVNGGAGLIFYMKPWLGLKAEGGYSYQTTWSGSEGKEYVLPKHPYASAGLVFRILNK